MEKSDYSNRSTLDLPDVLISRRQLLALGGALCVGGGLFKSNYARATTLQFLGKGLQELPRLSYVHHSTLLRMAPGLHRFHPWLPATPTWGIAGSAYTGPSIEAIAGTTTRLTFANQLGNHLLAANLTSAHGTRITDATQPRATMHLHGGVTSAQYDGNPEDHFLPGQSKTYLYPNQQEACHLWYHDHALGITRLNVFAGLAGQYFIRDAWDTGTSNNPLGLPSGDFEIPLVLQDKSISNAGNLTYRAEQEQQDEWIPGYFGDLSLVNGVAFPKLTVVKGVYRFRILNAANARFYSLSLSNKASLYVIGNDQGLLNAPVPTQVLHISPGERYDVLIDFSHAQSNSTIALMNTAIPPNTGLLSGTFVEVMRFVVANNTGSVRQIPTTLRGGLRQRVAIEPVQRIKPLNTRNVTLTMDLGQECHGTMPFVMRLNNMNYAQGAPERVRAGRWELWNIINLTNEAHPFHVHLAEMRILGRQVLNIISYMSAHPRPKRVGEYWAPSPDGHTLTALAPAALWEQGKKDTVNVPALGVTRVLVRVPTSAEAGIDLVSGFKSAEGKALAGYMYHCHMLEHEDCDMMRPFVVEE